MSNLLRISDSPPPNQASKRIGRAADNISAEHGIDFHEAIREHTEWRRKFCCAISTHQSLEVASISQDSACALGKWLRDDAWQAYRGLDGYLPCLDAHSAFHLEAAKVARAIDDKSFYEARLMLASGSDYSKAAIALGIAITLLMKAANLSKPRRQISPRFPLAALRTTSP